MKDLRESILDNDEDILDNTKIDEAKEIYKYISTHFVAIHLDLDKTNRIVNATKVVINKKTENLQLPFGWKWGNVKYLECSFNKNIKTLEDAPKECYSIYCGNCKNLESLIGLPKECSWMVLSCCPKLTTLKGAPEYGKGCEITTCLNLKDISAIKKWKDLDIDNCPLLK